MGISLAVFVAVFDLFTKHIALNALAEKNIIPVIDGFLNWRLAFNRGVSFSMLGDVALESLPEILAVFALVMGVLFVHWLGKHKDRLAFVLGLGLIAGGAVGNAVDRFMHCAVVDFIDVYYKTLHFPTFNVADIAISIGVVFVLIDAFLETQTIEKEEKEK